MVEPKPSCDEMKAAWKEFHELGRLENFYVRPETYASWQRSHRHGVDPYMKKNLDVLLPEELAERRDRLKILRKVSLPFMVDLHNFVAGSGFVVALADSEGYLVEVFGDSDAEEFTKAVSFIPGANLAEQALGTNAIGVCLVTGKPCQTRGYEHYWYYAHKSTCSAAPICDPQGKIMGVLDMTGFSERAHPHTLGMVVAAASAVEKQLELKKAWWEKNLADRYKEAIIEAISEGIVVIDAHGTVTHMNLCAAKALHLEREVVLGKRLEEVLDKESNVYLFELLNTLCPVTDEVVTIRTGTETIKCNVTWRPLRGSNEEETICGSVIVFHEGRRIHNLIQRMTGARARVTFSDLIGKNEAFLDAVSMAKAAASSSYNVLITGESGTGKDLLAQAIHNMSPRRAQPFVAINCVAIPRDLIGSELFGYAGGAFTGAKSQGNAGKFELADQGTLFLDEIGEMPLGMQATLLRVLENHEVVRIGGNEVIPVNVRIIAATNKDLLQEVERGNFRSDLYYRLNVMTIYLPALRDRREDIPTLARYFVDKCNEAMGKRVKEIDPEVMAIFLEYAWPGNIRELQNVIERAVNLATGSALTVELLPVQMRYKQVPVLPQRELAPIKSLEEQVIRNYLEKFHGNKTMVAKELGFSRSTLYRKLREYAIV